jgi:hypothetical protein
MMPHRTQPLTGISGQHVEVTSAGTGANGASSQALFDAVPRAWDATFWKAGRQKLSRSSGSPGYTQQQGQRRCRWWEGDYGRRNASGDGISWWMVGCRRRGEAQGRASRARALIRSPRRVSVCMCRGHAGDGAVGLQGALMPKGPSGPAGWPMSAQGLERGK